MRTATYDEARQWLKDKPRRMKANHFSAYLSHTHEHEWSPLCDEYPKCLPVDATVETHDGVTTDGHGKLLGRQGSEPRNWFCSECRCEVPPDHVTYDERHDERQGGCGRLVTANRPTPPPASAPGTPVERDCKHGSLARKCEICDLEKEVQEQRTRAEKLEERLDGYLAKHGAPPLTVKTHGYMLMENERDQLKADLAAARKLIQSSSKPCGWPDCEPAKKALADLAAAREREAKLREALTGLLVFHPDDEFGAELPKEYWMPEYRSAVEKAAAALAAAREELENLQASGIHSCHDKCQRPLCKMRRELDAAREREAKLREALEDARGAIVSLGDADLGQHEQTGHYFKDELLAKMDAALAATKEGA